MTSPKFIPTELKTKASASLAEEVEKELEVQDPAEQQVNAAIMKHIDKLTDKNGNIVWDKDNS